MKSIFESLIVLSWFSLLQLNVSGDRCHPCSCSCPKSLPQPCIDCRRLNLTFVPDFPTSLATITETLLLGYNLITTLKNDTFKSYKRLKVLGLVHNRIRSISKQTFTGLKNLRELHFRKNSIQRVGPWTFRELTSLAKLCLGENNISFVSPNAFNGLTNLKTLKLFRNDIRELKKATFRGLFRLEFLQLRYNFIEKIDKFTFLMMGNLNTLNLRDNRITSIPDALMVSKFTSVALSINDNPFPCSCQTINHYKQLDHRTRSLTPPSNYFTTKSKCSNVSSMCEERRNFAIGMNIAYGGVNCKSFFYAVDENLDSFGSCSFFRKKLTLRVDLPGIIFVSNVLTKIQTNHTYDKLTVEVGDYLSNTYNPCYNETLTRTTYTVNKSCIYHPHGRNIRISMRSSEIYINYKIYEIMVGGYDKYQYNIWSQWTQWAPCSKTCGTGIRTRNRTCEKRTSAKCLLEGREKKNKRALVDYSNTHCNLEPCFDAKHVYEWTIGSIVILFVLTVLGIVFWYRKFKMVRYFEGLRPNPNFELDPNRTLLEQIEELPYDVHWEFPRYDVRFGTVIGEGHFGKVWHAKAKGIKVSA